MGFGFEKKIKDARWILEEELDCVEWFEGIVYEPVNPYDPKIDYNYDVYL